MSLNFKAFACVYVYTFTSIHFGQLECTKPFDLDIVFCLQRFFYQVKHGSHNQVGFLLSDALFLTEQIDNVL